MLPVFIFKSFLRFTALSLAFLATSGSGFAASSANFAFQPGQTVNFSLNGSVDESIYETRSYETTCYRDEYETVYETQCTPRYTESCSTYPSCTDVSRPVCTGSGGCTDYLTRECTQQTSCSTVSDGEDCSQVSRTITHSIPYSCTQTETVKVGERFDHSEQGEFSVTFTGDGEAESAKDQFSLSVANGLDAGSGFHLDSRSTSGNYLFFLRRTNDATADRIDADSRTYRAEFTVQAVSVAKLIAETKLQVKNLKFSAKEIAFDLTTSPAPNYTVDLTISKDRRFASTKAIFSRRIDDPQMQVTTNPNGTKHFVIGLSQFGIDFNKRPHVAKVSVGIDLGAIFAGERLLNPADEAKVRSKLDDSASLKKKVR